VKQKKVKVRARVDATGAIDFEVDGAAAKNHRLKLKKDDGPHSIDFELQDHSGKELRFDTANPVWAGENCPCPPPQGLNSEQLTVGGCDPQTLTLVNQNSGAPREIRYQLNFIGADGSIERCDPIIDNGGGDVA
jgi:hypothetical protein